MWRRYLPFWGGAVVMGIVVGAGPTLLRSKPVAVPVHFPTTSAPTIPQERPTAEDREWEKRADVNVEPRSASELPGSRSSPATTTFGFCHTGGGTNCVVDGDTIWVEGQDVRIADIDAPETHEYRCAKEKALGDRATQRLIQLVNTGSVTLQPFGDRDVDRYGRKLRLVLVNGTSVGDTLVSEGLARYYEGGKRPWC